MTEKDPESYHFRPYVGQGPPAYVYDRNGIDELTTLLHRLAT